MTRTQREANERWDTATHENRDAMVLSVWAEHPGLARGRSVVARRLGILACPETETTWSTLASRRRYRQIGESISRLVAEGKLRSSAMRGKYMCVDEDMRAAASAIREKRIRNQETITQGFEALGYRTRRALGGLSISYEDASDILAKLTDTDTDAEPT